MNTTHHTVPVPGTGDRSNGLPHGRPQSEPSALERSLCLTPPAGAPGKRGPVALAVLCIAAFLHTQAMAQFAYETVKSIGPADRFGANPYAGLVVGSDGALYGTTSHGGSRGAGSVFRVNLDGTGYEVLHSFTGGDGSSPYDALVVGSGGALYGTTAYGGSHNGGTVFTLNPDGSGFAMLHSFSNTDGDGWIPRDALLFGTDGAIYGVTVFGGSANSGTVFKLNADGTGYQVLHSFGASVGEGSRPLGLVFGTDGALYGTTYFGGSSFDGTVFRLNTDGSSCQVLHSFNQTAGDGISPLASLAVGTDGALYGTTQQGGSAGRGTVFRLNADGSGYEVLYNFTGTSGDGAFPQGPLIAGTDGSWYGTTGGGGSADFGTVFKLNADGTGYHVLHSFSNTGEDGAVPLDGLVVGTDGNLYGTTHSGGSDGFGMVFKLNPMDGAYFVVHGFSTSNQGALPFAGLLVGPDAAVYGATYCGGSGGFGTVFRLNPQDGAYAVLYSFSNTGGDGVNPMASPIAGRDGALYGTTEAGGSYGRGTVFRSNVDGSGYQVLHGFSNTGGDGEYPYAALAEGSDGTLYGTTLTGGGYGGGTVFKINADGSGYQILHSFSGVGGDGLWPYAGLVMTPNGVLYGTTEEGGDWDYGTVFRLSTDGSGFEVLHSFGDTGGDGAYPYATLVVGGDGALYGTTYLGGSSDSGTIFRLNPADGAYSVVYSFGVTAGDGANPSATLIIGFDGALYGATEEGGGGGFGTVFRLNPADNSYNVLHNFSNTGGEGAHPAAGLVQDSDGDLYGTTPEGGQTGQGTVYRLVPANHLPVVASAIPEQAGTAGVPFTYTFAGATFTDADAGQTLSYTASGLPLGVAFDGPTRTFSGTPAAAGTFAVTLTATDNGVPPLSASTTFNIVVAPMVLTPFIDFTDPEAAFANGVGFVLRVYGDSFQPDAVVYWNGLARTTTFVSPTELSAVIPASDLVSTEPVSTATVVVINGGTQLSDITLFNIVASSVGVVQSVVAAAGASATSSTAPTTAGEPGVTATLQNTGGGPATVTTATYDVKPVGETSFRVSSGQFVDLQISGADSQDVATAVFYYPSTVTGTAENKVKLRYFNGTKWVRVLSSGGFAPVKDTTDNLDGTVSGGRFTVVFDSTSKPMITQLNGTVFGLFDSTPQINSVVGPTDPVPLGTAVTLSVGYATVGDPAAASVTFVWEDGTETVVAPLAEGVATATHLYGGPGVYPVTVRVTDEDGDMAESRFDYVVVYDPTAGFVTGSGWILSPPGAYTLDPTLTGKAKFGFESKYKRGATVPSGETEFEFSAGGFHFHSKTYQWLVLLGARAQFKGTGYIEGGPLCGFLLTATDGQLPLGGGTDKFRIRIWNQATGVMLYDNRRGAPEDINNADPQALGGGSITIKKAK